MDSREAKDFLVSEIMQQAALDRTPVSDLERRMMYFTESEDAVEDPIELNTAFEAEHDSAEFEKKIAALMKRAYARLKNENPPSAARWDEAIETLLAGDHYLLVMWDASGASRVPVAAVGKLAIRVLAPILVVITAMWAIRTRFGSFVRIGTILFLTFVALAIGISILQAVRPRATERLAEGFLKYLFGR
jgi:hypothetical protein